MGSAIADYVANWILGMLCVAALVGAAVAGLLFWLFA